MAAIALAAILAFPVAAQASVGVGIQENPVSLQKAARTGESYALPAVHIANTGSQDETIILKVQRVSQGIGRPVPASWIHFSDSQIELSAHQATKVSLELAVPDTAKTGDYLSDVIVIGAAVVPSKATNFRAAAATKLEFHVVPGPKPGLVASVPFWARWAIIILVLIGLAAIFNRIFDVKITRKPGDRTGAPTPAGSGAASPGGSGA